MILELNQIGFSYGKKPILENVNLSLDAGQCAVIAGQNGCGKTTLLSLIAGIYKPSSGSVNVQGKIGYVPQNPALIADATVGENLRFFADVAKCDIPKELPFDVSSFLKKRVSRISGGMKKQVSIACAMIGDPSVILLDEPCSALDIRFKNDLLDQVSRWKNEGKAIVYVGHDPHEITSIFDSLTFLGQTCKQYSRDELVDELSDASRFVNFFAKHLTDPVA